MRHNITEIIGHMVRAQGPSDVRDVCPGIMQQLQRRPNDNSQQEFLDEVLPVCVLKVCHGLMPYAIINCMESCHAHASPCSEAKDQIQQQDFKCNLRRPGTELSK